MPTFSLSCRYIEMFRVCDLDTVVRLESLDICTECKEIVRDQDSIPYKITALCYLQVWIQTCVCFLTSKEEC